MIPLLNPAIYAMTNQPSWGQTTGFAILAFAIGIAYLALVISALVSILTTNEYSTGNKALWFLVVIIAPFIGSIIWFIWGRRG